jgi:HD-GYP domain-containing protein (c-di-GMP phosphodiesterase class II)
MNSLDAHSQTDRYLSVFNVLLWLAGTSVIAISISGFGDTVNTQLTGIIFWVVLVSLGAFVSVSGLFGVRVLSVSPLIVLAAMPLFGPPTAVILSAIAWFVTTSCSKGHGSMPYVKRLALNVSKGAVSTFLAGLAYHACCPHQSPIGAAQVMVGNVSGILIPLLLAHGLYFAASTALLSLGLSLRDGRNPFEIWRANFGWGALVSWSTPLGAFLLAVFYLNGGFLLIGVLVGTGLIGILTVRDHVRIKSSFVRLVDALRLARDGNMPHLKGETHRVVELSVAIGHKMRLPYRSLELLEHAAMLHNVGYIAVDRDTVLKPALLTDAEMNEIRDHPESGMRILREVAGMEDVADIVSCHHESPDSTGYPLGLKGDEIPIEAAVIKVAEAFVAMTSPRPHRSKVFSRDGALEEIARDAGLGLDATVAYYLFQMMGRDDLAAKAAKGFGPPARQHIKGRYYKTRSKPLAVLPRSKKERRLMLLGASMVAAAAFIVLGFARLGLPEALGFTHNWIASSTPGSLFFLFLLGLAALRPVRLPWGAYVSAASAVGLAISLAGGPVYAVTFGFALIGWAMLLDPANALSSSFGMISGLANGRNGYDQNGVNSSGKNRGHTAGALLSATVNGKSSKSNGGITSILKSKALQSRLSTASAYGFVLMIAGSSAWSMYHLGTHTSTLLGLRGTVGEFIPFVLSVGSFYFVETIVQAALLSHEGLSAKRLWQRNYLKIFPEPLTYAISGYAILLGTNLLGLWAAIPLFLFPTLWRHLALLRRLELLESKDSLIRAIARAVDEKDRYTGGHSASVVEISIAIARSMGKSEPFVEQIEEAAIRHDLGKVSWPNQVLRKPAVLNEREEEEYKWTHPDVSAEIAARAGSSESVTEMIRYHHERYDGKGYPHKLMGDDIPLGSRILCVSDSFDAMIHDRWYKRKRTIQDAVDEIERCSGTQFDPKVVKAFLDILERTDLESLIEAVEIGVGEIKEEVGAVT